MRESSGRSIGFVLLCGIAVLAVGYVLFGPRPTSDIPGDRIVLNYWEKWTGTEAAAMQLVVDAFNASQDRIHVNYLTMSSIDEKAMLSIAWTLCISILAPGPSVLSNIIPPDPVVFPRNTQSFNSPSPLVAMAPPKNVALLFVRVELITESQPIRFAVLCW